MTEKEKMLNGKLYDPTDKELTFLRNKARQSAIDFNNTNESEQEKRYQILKDILGNFGDDLFIEPSIRFDYGCNTYFGKDCYVNFNSVFLDCGEIRIGDNVFIGPNASFYTAIHPLVPKQRNIRTRDNGEKYDLEYAKPITVGNNVWFGGSVVVNGGVTIGDNTVIASGSVVTKNIPSGVIAAGVPCRVLREITDDDLLEEENT